VRYWKGSIVLSPTRDYPLLRQVLHSRFVTHSQLFEFLKLDYCVSSRNAFSSRVLRLVKHGLVVRHESRPSTGRDVVYSISETGTSELVARGECLVWADQRSARNDRMQLAHFLELNEIHLALKRTGMLVYWTPETEVRSQSDLTSRGYAKYYDAVVMIRLDGRDFKFALEYERTPKAMHYYESIRQRIDMEASLSRFLYLAPSFDLLHYVAEKLERCKRTLYFGLFRDFLEQTLALPVKTNASPVSLPLSSALLEGKDAQHTGMLFPRIGV
jgi:hypothetical protein